MKTIKIFLATPRHIACQIFYALILTLIICFLSGQEIRSLLFIKAEIITLVNMIILHFVMKLFVNNSSSVCPSPAQSGLAVIAILMLCYCMSAIAPFLLFGDLQNLNFCPEAYSSHYMIIGIGVPVAITFLFTVVPAVVLVVREGTGI